VAQNPDVARITDPMWRFMEALLRLEPGTKNGGIYAYKAGYHNTRRNLLNHRDANGDYPWRNDYSIRLPEDRRGPDDKACAWDWTFPDAQAGRYATIIKYGDRIEAAFNARDPRLRGHREVLIQADPDTYAEGFDFVGWYRRTPDSSHLWHGHGSVLRAYVGEQWPYDNMLSILSGESLAAWRARTEDDMANVNQADWDALIWRFEALIAGRLTVAGGPDSVKGDPVVPNQKLAELGLRLAALEQKVTTEATADAQRDAELRALIEAHASGQISAEAVVQRLGVVLSASAQG
jgi:hypothetical protein